jgi:carbon-monoxide dehydrogenase medium subunit
LDYYRPADVEEAVDLLSRFGGEAKVLAGGQSLMPLINMRLARPAVLIDINRLAELNFIREEDGFLSIGALTRHAAIERSETARRVCPLLSEATALIGYPSIRARATFGGSMAHADPAAEYPSSAVALEASLTVRGPHGARRIAATDFFKGLLTTDLAEDELITDVRIPAQPRAEGWAYTELATRPGDYATVGVIARLGLDAEGRLGSASLTCTSVGPRPIQARRAAASLLGALPTPEALDAASALAAEEVEPESDALSSASYKRAMTRVMTRRALEKALQRATRA